MRILVTNDDGVGSAGIVALMFEKNPNLTVGDIKNLFQQYADHDAETGKMLWTTTMPAGSRGVPSMYEVNGRQFFVVNATSSIVAARGRSAGAGATAAPPLARAYVAYALPQ